jgi:hypothetical protein
LNRSPLVGKTYVEFAVEAGDGEGAGVGVACAVESWPYTQNDATRINKKAPSVRFDMGLS